MKKTTMAQVSLFDVADEHDGPEQHESPTSARRYDWEWWDDLPEGLSHKQALIWQIRRDLRGAEETDNEDEREFLIQRIAEYRVAVHLLSNSSENEKSSGAGRFLVDM